MLKIEQWQELATRSGLEVDKLQAAIASEKEETIELSNVTILTDAQLNEMKETVGKASAKTGAKTLIEMEVKALRDKNGLEFEGKTIENLLNAHADKQVKEAKIAPDKKVLAAEESLKNLQKTYNTDIGLKENDIKSLNAKVSEYQINGDLAKHLPELAGIKPTQFITLAKTEFGFENLEGTLVAKKGDSVLKDKLEKPIPVKEVLTDYAKSNGWTENGGRGGGDNGGGGSGDFKTMNDVYKYMDENSIDPSGSEGEKLVADFLNSKK